MPTRIGLIGCGEHSRENLIPSLWALRYAKIVAICDTERSLAEQTAARFPDAVIESDFQYLIAREDVDAIVVAATPQIHYSAALQAIRRGIHVFVEKPPTETRAALEELAEEARRNNVITLVGHNLRYTRAAQEMQKRLVDPPFGRAVAMEMRYFASKPRGIRWGLESELRSFLLSHANHAIDFMIFQLGHIREVNAALESGGADGIALTAQLIFESGAVGTLFASSLAPHFMINGTIISDRNQIVQMNSLNEIVCFGADGDEKRWGRCWTGRTLEAGYESAGYLTELQAFVDAIRTSKRTIQPSFADELSVYFAMEKIEEQICKR